MLGICSFMDDTYELLSGPLPARISNIKKYLFHHRQLIPAYSFNLFHHIETQQAVKLSDLPQTRERERDG